MPDRLALHIDRTETPLGDLNIVADGEGCLRAIYWTDYQEDLLACLNARYGKGGFTLTPTADPNGLTSALNRTSHYWIV